MSWSAWSDPVSFNVKGSTGGITNISTAKTNYSLAEDIPVHYQFGPGNSRDWIGIYKKGDIPGQAPSTDWAYVTGDSGTVNLQVVESGSYYIGFFEDDGYNELADRINVYVISIPVLSSNKAGYEEGEQLRIDYINAPGLTNDWIGIYGLSDIPGITNSTRWMYTTGTEGYLLFEGLEAGYYFAGYFLEDGYTEAGERIIFTVDPLISALDKNSGEKDMIIFPSPASGKFTIKMPDSGSTNFSLTISTLAGINVLEKTYEIPSSMETLDVDLKEFIPGIYIISLQSNEKKYTKRIIIR